MTIAHVPDKNPIHHVSERVRLNLAKAQENTFERTFADGFELCGRVLDDLKVSIAPPQELRSETVAALSDQTHAKLSAWYFELFVRSGVPDSGARLHAEASTQRTHLIRAFDEPEVAIEWVSSKVESTVADFPKKASDIERGRNPGDVLDPYIFAATQALLYSGDFSQAVGATVAHKALMIIEGLMGHLHEEVIGRMRGNVKAPEPRGFNQEIIHPETNPFPGADIVQPPNRASEKLRFHQVKSKTGSAKGGDGKRIGEQLRTLAQYYRGDIFFDALIGNTLRGHRSMSGLLNAAPETNVLVGEAAFEALTGSKIGPELLMRVYQTAFVEASLRTGYSIDAMVAHIVESFGEKSRAMGEGYLQTILQDATSGPVEQQNSRFFARRGA